MPEEDRPSGATALHRRPSGQRRGVTLVELLMVVLVVGILARLSIPAYDRISLKARAAGALADINAIRLAAYQFNSETNRWPADVNRGTLPPELAPYLGPEFSFRRDGYVLDWDNWMLPDGSPRHGHGVMVGVSLTTGNRALGQALIDLVGENAAVYTIRDHYTFIIAASR